MPKGPSMLAGLSPDVRQLLAKQVKDARLNPNNDATPTMIPTQPPAEGPSADAGPGPSTISARSRSEGDEEPASKRRKTSPSATVLPTGETIKSSWDASELVKRFTVENWEEEMPEDIKKYFHQRNNLFSRYNTHNILLDHTGWYSVTPEKIAQHIAERCRCDTVLDGFAGVGGNLIAFAWTCERVIAIDTSMERLKIARHNAMQYGVADRIEFICADYVEFVGSWARRKQRQREEKGEAEVVVGLGEEVDVIFLSPPWGGTEYLTATTNDTTDPEASFAIDNHLPPFPLDTLLPLPAKELYDLSRQMTPNIAFFLPRNSSPNEIAAWADETPIDPNNLEVGGKEFVEIEELWMGRSKENPFKPGAGSKNRRSVGKKGADGKLKALNAYFGGLAGAGEP